ncbi:MAG: aminoacyl-tRNA hydrolase [Erysipelotrichaceae bacterium]|nr:aminoacyl-tRNA hydrolase [Erysipelotrichaceae bacterium]
MKLIVGLGNPDEKYDQTRHNTGFMVMDLISGEMNTPITQKKFNALLGSTTVKGEKVLLMKPLTYMNLSGDAIVAAMNYYHIEPKDLCVIYDDMDLPCGKIRLREQGSAGGHNGMKSIIANLHTDAFPRIRVGIDKHEFADTVDYVLGRFTKEQRELLDPAMEKAAKAAIAFCTMKFQDVMNRYNR